MEIDGLLVELLYDQYGNCCAVQPVVPDPQDLIDFGIEPSNVPD